MQTILVTGANGFVGHYLSALLVTNYKVITTGKGPCRINISHKNFHYEAMDFTDESSVKDVFQHVKPAIVIHAGAISKPDECELNKEFAYLTNVTSTQYLLAQSQLFQSFLYTCEPILYLMDRRVCIQKRKRPIRSIIMAKQNGWQSRPFRLMLTIGLLYAGYWCMGTQDLAGIIF